MNNIIEEGKKMKTGYKTTEFWLVIITNLLAVVTAFNGLLDPKTAGIIVAVLNGLYAILRSVVKINTPDATTPDVPPTASIPAA